MGLTALGGVEDEAFRRLRWVASASELHADASVSRGRNGRSEPEYCACGRSTRRRKQVRAATRGVALDGGVRGWRRCCVQPSSDAVDSRKRGGARATCQVAGDDLSPLLPGSSQPRRPPASHRARSRGVRRDRPLPVTKGPGMSFSLCGRQNDVLAWFVTGRWRCRHGPRLVGSTPGSASGAPADARRIADAEVAVVRTTRLEPPAGFGRRHGASAIGRVALADGVNGARWGRR